MKDALVELEVAIKPLSGCASSQEIRSNKAVYIIKEYILPRSSEHISTSTTGMFVPVFDPNFEQVHKGLAWGRKTFKTVNICIKGQPNAQAVRNMTITKDSDRIKKWNLKRMSINPFTLYPPRRLCLMAPTRKPLFNFESRVEPASGLDEVMVTVICEGRLSGIW